jgi:threonyl-tRNA synthetase
MRILQFDVENMSYEVIAPEIAVHEDASPGTRSVEGALVLFTSVEKGDTEDTVKKAIDEAMTSAAKLGGRRLLIYPFAHLSSNLEAPAQAMKIIETMRQYAKSKGAEFEAAPFGWNKRFSLSVKGHPLAEQSRSYGGVVSKAITDKKKPDLSIVRKSDWINLPPNDHRSIGERLDLFSFQEISPAMVYWHPKGYTIYKELVKFMRDKEAEYDYREISTPGMANVALWHMSGHADYYSNEMFIFDSDFGSVSLKPMNCPSTIMVYKSRKWSYRDMPFRTAIFDKIYRKELSGVVTGLFRVKELTQDDGHIFAMEDQIEGEAVSLLRMVSEVYSVFGMRYTAKLSTMPEKHLGTEELWEKATDSLKTALDANKIPYEINEKDGAFYGPKIDFDVFDSAGRAWQCATMQLDYQLPLRFGLSYTGSDGMQHTPVIIHRAILGSLERFIAILLEHYKGKLPTWISPVQARVVSISEQSNRYAETVYAALKKGGARAELDVSDKTLEYKIRDAQLSEVNYIVVVGKKEEEAGKVAVRSRSGKQEFGVPVESLLKRIIEESSGRRDMPGQILG